ncbi:MAG TPA: PIN domain-containing protein [Leptospiraceae bacterium]|nr:PIN domain-containing protein [Leptospiraceae bacterium]HMW05012.1 PIN domain-containing protein [Leptospiraceae bacterium]HMX31456.1 PIN domain-containing protein [Leptospiraceae bacterium]HMY33566.1 PIN domain-containing protein [Leptospiraceae bacterium]HMZ62565.1 PIN domain-containing protein [Leptospiraceae bacterium]
MLPEDAQLFVSDLTRMECRVKPIQDNNALLLEEYDLFFSESVEIVNLTNEVINKATEIRAKYSFKTPDSIHLASAIINESNFFITNDKRLSSFKEIEILKL